MRTLDLIGGDRPFSVTLSYHAPQQEPIISGCSVLEKIQELSRDFFLLIEGFFKHLPYVRRFSLTPLFVQRVVKDSIWDYLEVHWIVLKIFLFLGEMGIFLSWKVLRFSYNQVLYQRKEKEQIDLSYYAKKWKGLDEGYVNISYKGASKRLSTKLENIPEKVSLEDLEQIFKELNFEDSTNARYVHPERLLEEGNTYSKEDLGRGLQVFINNVKNRVPLIGTPREDDTEGVEQFYGVIEDSTRFCIHESNQRLESFTKIHGEDTSSYSKEVLQEYKSIFEDRARIVLDLAIIGAKGLCGTRYMGAAQILQNYWLGEKEEEGTLKGALEAILEKARSGIAQRHAALIQDENGSSHSYVNYLACFGKALGITTTGVSDILSNPLDPTYYLDQFFQEYTKSFIKGLIQEKIKKSQSFREKIIDWLKDQKEDWIGSEISLEDAIQRGRQVVARKEIEQGGYFYKNLEALGEYVSFLKKSNGYFSEPESNSELFIENLFPKEPDLWAAFCENKQVSEKGEQARFKWKLQNLFSTEQFGEALSDEVKKRVSSSEVNSNSLLTEVFSQKLLELQKIGGLCAEGIQLERDVALRVVQENLEVESAIKSRYSRLQGELFLQALVPEADQLIEQGLPDKVLDWVLFSHEIFLLPKGETALSKKASPQYTQHIFHIISESFTNPLPHWEKLKKREPLSSEEERALRSCLIRSLPDCSSACISLERLVFELAYQLDKQKVLDEAQKITGSFLDSLKKKIFQSRLVGNLVKILWILTLAWGGIRLIKGAAIFYPLFLSLRDYLNGFRLVSTFNQLKVISFLRDLCKASLGLREHFFFTLLFYANYHRSFINSKYFSWARFFLVSRFKSEDNFFDFQVKIAESIYFLARLLNLSEFFNASFLERVFREKKYSLDLFLKEKAFQLFQLPCNS